MEKFYNKSSKFYDDEYDPKFNHFHFERYASKRWKLLNKIINQDNPDFKMDEILDLGCGEGNFTNFINNQSESNIIGVDASNRCCDIAKKRYNDITILNEDCENLSFNDNTFDLVFTNAVLHHVEDIEKAILEAYRVVKTSGYIVFIEPNRYHPLQILHGLASKHERGTLKFSMSKIRILLNKYFSDNQFWIEPLNTYLYVRKNFPGKNFQNLFIFLEDLFEYYYLSTHYLIMAKK